MALFVSSDVESLFKASKVWLEKYQEDVQRRFSKGLIFESIEFM